MALIAEKYRPTKFEEIIGLPKEVVNYVKGDNVPSFLFSGSPGTGKTTTAKVIASFLGTEVMKLNASDETGIDTIRGKISSFAMAKSIGNQRVAILDEADGLSIQAQQTLRGTIDKFQKNCIFVLTCNYDFKIIDALKQGRTIHIKFDQPKAEEVVARLKFIAQQEGYAIEDKAAQKLVAFTYPDIRNAITQMERIAIRDGKKVTEKAIDTHSLEVPVLIELLKNKKLIEAGALVDKQYVDVERLIDELSDEFFYGKDYSGEQKKQLVVNVLRRAYVEISRVKNKKPIIRPMLYEIMKILEEGN